MTTVTDVGERALSGNAWLIAGIMTASLTEAIAGTVLALGRSDVMGDIHTTPDEFAWLDISYIAMKLVGFAFTPWLLSWVEAKRALIVATGMMGVAALLASILSRLDVLIVLRLVQGMSGAILLVSGQAILFWRFEPARQPVIQALFAMGAVVAPATVAPFLQGWLLDTHNWAWIYFLVLPLAMLAIGFLLIAPSTSSPMIDHRKLDGVGLVAIMIVLFAATWLLSQGNRWDWFELSINRYSLIAIAAALLIVAKRQRNAHAPLFDLTLFRTDDFTFAFVVSFVAGAALFGSAFLIPSFALSVLGFTPTEAGALLFPSGTIFALTLFTAALLMQLRGLPPIATVPFGILSTMVAMWMLSGATVESGSAEMMVALLIRGFGLGCLFLSITLIAFSRLAVSRVAFGIGLFNIGRQLGGLLGVAGLQTLIEHHSAINRVALGAAFSPGSQALLDRMSAYVALLTGRGMEPGAASAAASALLARSLGTQGIIIAFNTAFNALALLFVAAVPVMLVVKVTLARRSARRSDREVRS